MSLTTVPQRIQDYLTQLSSMQKDQSKTKEEIEEFQRRFLEQEQKLAQHAIAMKRNEQQLRRKEYWTRIKELEVEERIEQKKQRENVKEKQVAELNALRLRLKEIKALPDQREVLKGIEELILEVQKMM
ncbi:Hypothetical_protein [Hexamita inflata]|uniref:Hypothetical_protein n=1 Tax=Hexamita inflata TaxID=28002 RepID=A0AA86RWA5_9EUKA|nr:Hypothetical protein HINF_LOCUS24761 [Hexamita inflata]CAI9945712.1 Hypothetical protein HINF_LOCUS33357 [Hexamita inflata]CAI9961352.1 Hypothetical protein HINF_LOCUS48997 [Hexamita inflata]CAI9973745.1 Hypothetical protein HINF_LOCUS61390 [Hexamita inflata]